MITADKALVFSNIYVTSSQRSMVNEMIFDLLPDEMSKTILNNPMSLTVGYSQTSSYSFRKLDLFEIIILISQILEIEYIYIDINNPASIIEEVYTTYKKSLNSEKWEKEVEEKRD